MNSGTSNFLNASRWVAAFFVVLYHVYNLAIVNHGPEPLALFFRGVHFFCGFGHVAVIVFFVISGFLIGGRTISNLQTNEFEIKDYFVHRFSRIYTVFVPALIAGYLIDQLGLRFFNSSGIYNHPDQFYINAFGNDIATHLSPSTLIGNFLQLQTITVSVSGSNGPLWSLANEWWYYMLFGCGIISYRSRRISSRVIAGSLIFAMILALPPTISLWFVIWAIGAGVAVLDRYCTGWRFFYGATIGIICLVAVRRIGARGGNMGMTADFALDLVVALGYSVALLCAKNLGRPGRFRTFHRRFASFSYSVYLVHFPAMVFVAAMIKDVIDIGFARQPSVGALVYAALLVVVLYGYAWIFAALTEAYTDAVRLRLGVILSALQYRATSMALTEFLKAANATASVLINAVVPRAARPTSWSPEAGTGPAPGSETRIEVARRSPPPASLC